MKLWLRTREIEKKGIATDVNPDHISLTQMRTALNALPIGVVIYDVGGNEWWLNRAAHAVVDQQRGHQDMAHTMTSLSNKALHGRTSTVHVDVDGPRADSGDSLGLTH